MAKIEVKDEQRRIEITSDVEIAHTQSEMSYINTLSLLSARLHNIIPVTRIRFKRDAVPEPPYAVSYDYTIWAADGRIWRQHMGFLSLVAEAEMSFDVPDHWKLSEFSLQRELRDHFIRLVRDKQVSDADVRWI